MMASLKKLALPILASSLLITPKLLAKDETQRTTELLFTAENPVKFEKALAKAKTLKIPKQVLLEARFLHYIDQENEKALAALSNELMSLENGFDPKVSQIFTLSDDWKAITHYTNSLAALHSGNIALFKKHITEAFWLSPRQASAFAPHIEQLKTEQAMAKLTIRPEKKLTSILNGKPQSLINTKLPATIIYFWSPWSQEFASSIEEFKSLCSQAKQYGIQLSLVLAEPSKEVEADAVQMIMKTQLTKSAQWLEDSPAMELFTKLRIQNIPTAVVVTPKGKITFNGTPSSDAFQAAIKQLVPAIKFAK